MSRSETPHRSGIDAGLRDGLLVHVDADSRAVLPTQRQLDKEIAEPAADVHHVIAADLPDEFQNPGNRSAAEQRVPRTGGYQPAGAVQPGIV